MNIGTFSEAPQISDNVSFYPVLDLISPSNYNGQTAWVYGHDGTKEEPHDSPRIIPATITSVISNASNGDSYFTTAYTDVILQDGDSGSPVFIPWSDPEGNVQLTILGLNSATDTNTSRNFHSLLATDHAKDATNDIMDDDGYVLKWVADIDSMWQGSGTGNGDDYDWLLNWTPFGEPQNTDYAGFDSDDPVATAIDLDGSVSARGWIFKEGATAFSFSNGTASIGRGGMINYDADSQQVFSNNFILEDSQWWDVGGGGFAVSGALDLSTYTLIVTGEGSSSLSGVISGTGQLAKEGSHTLTLSGLNTYSGDTWLHRGMLIADNNGSLGTGVVRVQRDGELVIGSGVVLGNSILIQPEGRLSGVGAISSALTVESGAIVAPGSSPGTLSGSSMTFGQDGVYEWEINNAVGTAGADPGWDTISLSGTLDITATAVNPYVIKVTSLTAGNVAGAMTNFSATNSYSWVIVSAAGGITNFDRGDVIVDTAGVSNSFGNGIFTVTTANLGTELVVRFLPDGYAQDQLNEFSDDELDNILLSGPDADFDGDGLTNFTEYAFDLNPKVAESSLFYQFGVEDDGGTDYLTMDFQRMQDAPDIEYRIEVVDNVSKPDNQWTLIAASLRGSAMTAESGFSGVVLQDTGSGVISVKVRDNLEFGSKARRFLRL
ncbi:MAG: hypothetical protein AAF571_07820, partial [Verrucomicrobiota bacterium]